MKNPLPHPKPKNEEFGWRTYLATDLERPAKIVAINRGVDVRQLLSEIIKENLPEVKILQ